MNNEETSHKRRVRYKGNYPKNFKEKYKELEPDKYVDTIVKVIEKGITPAGMHIPICVEEILNILKIMPKEIGLDATLGYGGHSYEMLKCLKGQGHLYALDIDPIEIEKTKERLNNLGYNDNIFTPIHLNFANIDKIIPQTGKFDFILADLGVSSMQIDNPERGFSYKNDGPLDLRLNPNEGISASDRLKDISLDELEGMLIENADEPYAEVISKAIISYINKNGLITTTSQLRNIIEKSLDFINTKEKKEEIKKSCQRTFQALRIDINNEFEVLYEFLEKLPKVLKENGRVAILTFHSGEDRLVKKSFKQLYKDGTYKEISNEIIRPSIEEYNKNPRSHSAKLRWAIKK
ncbi:MAG: 16S rRNA (cytosine(1402)-N(4))-methyltransferase RsmH [Bacilli bacterium]